MLVAAGSIERFTACLVSALDHGGELRLPAEAMEALPVGPGDELWYTEL